MTFRPSTSMKISLSPEDARQLSSKERIEAACRKENVFAFDIYAEEQLIGFIMVRKYAESAFFLWNYAIDQSCQNRHYGTAALLAFIRFMQETFRMTELSTTYLWGNDRAKHLYEKIGFTETDVVDEDGCHEVNMIYSC